MIRIGCVETYATIDANIQETICPRCGKKIDTSLGRIVQKAYILFVPFLKKTIARITVCPECGCEYSLTKEQYRSIMDAGEKGQEWYNSCKTNLEKSMAKAKEYCQPSEKNIAVAALFSLFLGFFGLQNLYMGHMKRFVISIVLLLSGFATFFLMFIPGVNTDIVAFIPASFWAANVYWGLVDFFRLISSHAKDGKRKYIITKNKYKKKLAEYRSLCSEQYEEI